MPAAPKYPSGAGICQIPPGPGVTSAVSGARIPTQLLGKSWVVGKGCGEGGTPLPQVSELLDLILVVGTGWGHPEPPAPQFLLGGWACLASGLGMLGVSARVSTLGIVDISDISSIIRGSVSPEKAAAAARIDGTKGWDNSSNPRDPGMLCPTVKGPWVGKGIDGLYLLIFQAPAQPQIPEITPQEPAPRAPAHPADEEAPRVQNSRGSWCAGGSGGKSRQQPGERMWQQLWLPPSPNPKSTALKSGCVV